MVKVRDDAGKREEQSQYEELIGRLQALEAKARSEGKGVWSTTDNGQIEGRNDYPTDMAAFLQEWKGKQIDGELPWLRC